MTTDNRLSLEPKTASAAIHLLVSLAGVINARQGYYEKRFFASTDDSVVFKTTEHFAVIPG
jgi:hypothetical protein